MLCSVLSLEKLGELCATSRHCGATRDVRVRKCPGQRPVGRHGLLVRSKLTKTDLQSQRELIAALRNGGRRIQVRLHRQLFSIQVSQEMRRVLPERIAASVDIQQALDLDLDGRNVGLGSWVSSYINQGPTFQPIEEEKHIADVRVRITTTIREPLQVSTPRIWRDIRVARPIAHKSQRGHHRRRRDTQLRIYQRWVDLPIAISKPRADVEQTT